MSFCPSKDIHSVYLDGELPEVYKAEYETHIKDCPQCQKQLAQLKGVKKLFQDDSNSLNLDSHFMEESFNRLQIKMAYSKNTVPNKKSYKHTVGYFISAAAAAAVFALIIPIRINTIGNSAEAGTSVASVFPVTTAKEVSFDSRKSVLVSGNIQESDLSRKRANDAALIQNVKDVDLLRPNFGDESISIRITVPGVGEEPVVTEINLPMDYVISGRF